MNLKTILLPPNTIPQDWLIRQLLIFFDEIFLYAASEDSCNDDNIYSHNKMLNHYAPVPFGSGLKDFQRLITDIKKNRAEFYSGGIFSLSAEVHNIDESAVWQLVSKIMDPESQADRQDKTLLEARLLLRLSEIVTSEEEEINLELNKVNRLADSLLDELKDEKSKKLTVAPVVSKAVSGNLSKLIKAWSYLFMADKNPARPWIAATGSLEVFELLSDHYNIQLTKLPRKLFSLPLPGFEVNDPGEHFIEQRNLFRQSVQGCVQALKKELQRISGSGGPIEAGILKEAMAVWQEQATMVVGGESSPAQLDFYLFQGLSLPELFARIAKCTAPPQNNEFPAHGIVALIN